MTLNNSSYRTNGLIKRNSWYTTGSMDSSLSCLSQWFWIIQCYWQCPHYHWPTLEPKHSAEWGVPFSLLYSSSINHRRGALAVCNNAESKRADGKLTTALNRRHLHLSARWQITSSSCSSSLILALRFSSYGLSCMRSHTLIQVSSPGQNSNQWTSFRRIE